MANKDKAPPPLPIDFDVEEANADIIDDMNDWDVGSMVLLEADMDGYLWAIHDLVGRLRRHETETGQRIKKIEARSNHPSWTNHDVDYLIDQYYSSGFQSAAHSVATTAMLASFIEPMFKQAFRGIRDWLEREDRMPSLTHRRWRMKASHQWNCKYVSGNEKPNRNIAAGIVELAEAVGLAPDLPSNLGPTLDVLFRYRNNVLHDGFEWPPKTCSTFSVDIVGKQWPNEWFGTWKEGDKITAYYLTDVYIDHCLKTISSVISGIGKFLRRNRRRRRT